MMKNNKHIEIVRSTSKSLSSMSQTSCDAIFAVLAKHFEQVGVTIVNTAADLDALVASQPDLVFLGMEYVPSDPVLGSADPHKIWISDVLDDYEIAYTGSSQTAHVLERHKHLAKQRVLDAGLKTSAFCLVNQGQRLESGDITLDFPLFIKPTNLGGGAGIDGDSVAHNFEQLQSKVHAIHTSLGAASLIEEYLPGREFSVAILKDELSDEFLAMPIELIAPPDENGSRILGDQVKSSNVEQVFGVTDQVIRSRVTSLALNVFHALGARDYGRIDIRLDGAGTPHFLEANLIPSLISGYGSFPKACLLNIGLGYESMIMRIIRLGLVRSTNESLRPLVTGESVAHTSLVAIDPI